MAKKPNISRYSRTELDKMAERGEDRAGWMHVRALTESDLERAIADDPESDPPIEQISRRVTSSAGKTAAE